ncbi:hypothetical protein BU23DRAFT_601999 [Bimuria novae-zelandiae CBS 107.79]|uniref:FAD linked oxidase N-terminal domain-containing protein n=1 Tax=Bimuria novae-zelandiae CBS 107.79 TaxID=1447943 RepID=A0A6A5UVG6_9PLEO|nr:hypothetical protein BU23DRAFT_601999 [Bimuria novae-zelandiae CBS 107.79]
MRGITIALSFLLSFSRTFVQSTFEAPTFEAAEALRNNGVDMLAIPALSTSSNSTTAGACAVACSALAYQFEGDVLHSNTSTYDTFTTSYWSLQQASISPHCIFTPTTPFDIPTFILISRLTQCSFAMNSGGHAAFAGARSIQGGITVAFDKMKEIALEDGRSLVGVQPGNTWHDVYKALEEEGVAVVGGRMAASEFEYAKLTPNAPIFFEYLAIPAIQDGTMIRTLANLTLQMNIPNPNGLRQTFWTATFKLDKEFSSFAADLFFEEVLGVADASALLPSLTLQVTTDPMLQNSAKKGGNTLDLSEQDGPLLLLSNMMWASKTDDDRILGTNKRIIDRAVAEEKESQFQQVIPSYGAENQARLKAVAREYDQQGVFQHLQPGYFKLEGAPSLWEQQ